MKVTKKTRLLKKVVPIFEDAAIGLKVFSIESADGGKPKIGQEPWIMRGEGIRMAEAGKGGFSPEDQFFAIGDDYHGSVSITPAADGKSATLHLAPVQPVEFPAGDYTAKFITMTFTDEGAMSENKDYEFPVVKD